MTITNEELQAVVTYMAEDIAKGLGAGAHSSAALTVDGASFSAEDVRALVIGAAVNTCNHYASEAKTQERKQSRKGGLSSYPTQAKKRRG